MFDGFFKSKFYNKSKTAIKVTKMRLEMIKKKRAAVDRYLRKDIADLLRNDLDINAYGRAEGLLVERNMTSCYDFVDQFCGCISPNHIIAMQKQSECPEECREAVSSLMYAAARFADLPELRELRTLFREKFGDSLDSFVNEEFVGRLRSKPISKDTKLELIRDIAAEFTVDWSSKALEQKLFDPNQPKQVRTAEWKDSRDNSEKSTSRSSEVNATELPQKADEHGIGKQSSSSSSSPSDEEVMQKRPLSYRDITPPYAKSKDNTREGDGVVDSVQDQQKPKPKSVRQRKSKLPPGEEKVMDKQLPYETDEVADKHAPVRVSSLPLESTTQEEATATGKGHCRSSSLQPEVLAFHVHPNLPDYDGLAARLAALRGR